MRTDKINYYLDVAETVLKRSTCLRRNYGAILVKNDEIIATGYNGSPRGSINCSDKGVCRRNELKIASGERYELCEAVHAEQNVIISASRKDMIGSTLYLVGKEHETDIYVKDTKPCLLCGRFIKNAEIHRVIVRVDTNNYEILNK